jgi:hypothetical protein
MPLNPFKSGRAVGKGVKYLTELGSKVAKGLGRSIDKLGSGTRNTQASVIKGGRAIRDAGNATAAAAKAAASEAKRGYDVGRRGGMHLSDVADAMPKKSNTLSNRPTLNEWLNTQGKGYMKNPATMPGNKPSGIKANADASGPWEEYLKVKTTGKNYLDANNKYKSGKMYDKGYNNVRKAAPGSEAIPVWKKYSGFMPTPEEEAAAKKRAEEATNYMKKAPSGNMNKPPRRPRSTMTGGGDYMSNQGPNYRIGKRISDTQFAYSQQTPGMSKNRRAGIITAGSAAAGYGVYKGNEALQNHYQRQKNASRGM